MYPEKEGEKMTTKETRDYYGATNSEWIAPCVGDLVAFGKYTHPRTAIVIDSASEIARDDRWCTIRFTMSGRVTSVPKCDVFVLSEAEEE
jgi:hypothetical protein